MMSKNSVSYPKEYEECNNTFDFFINPQLDHNFVDGQTAKFNLQIPAFSLTKDNISKRAYIKLKSLYFGGLNEHNARDVLITEKPGFIVNIKGLGIRNSSFVLDDMDATNLLKNNDFFYVPNEYYMTINNAAIGFIPSIAGSTSLDIKKLCSNPFGTNLMIEVKTDVNTPITITDGTRFNLHFQIVFVEPDIDQNFV